MVSCLNGLGCDEAKSVANSREAIVERFSCIQYSSKVAGVDFKLMTMDQAQLGCGRHETRAKQADRARAKDQAGAIATGDGDSIEQLCVSLSGRRGPEFSQGAQEAIEEDGSAKRTTSDGGQMVITKVEVAAVEVGGVGAGGSSSGSGGAGGGGRKG